MRKKSILGITFVEVMVTLLLFTLIIGGLYSILLVGNNAWQNFEASVLAQQEARRVLATMVQDFRVAENLVIFSSEKTLTVSFHHPQHGNILYTWSSVGVQAGQLMRQSSASIRPLGRSIRSIKVVAAGKLISINLTSVMVSRKGEEIAVSLGQKVYGRR